MVIPDFRDLDNQASGAEVPEVGPPPKKQTPVPIAVVGAGRWGRVLLSVIQKAPQFALAGVQSNNPKTRELVQPDCPVLTDTDALLDLPDLAGLVIATPPATHVPLVRKALAQGVPCLVEKPFSMDEAEIRALVQEFGLDMLKKTILVDHVQLFNGAFMALQERLAQIGTIQHILAEGGSYGPFRPDYGPLWDYGPHDVALILALTGSLPSGATISSSKNDALDTLDTLERRQGEESSGANYHIQLHFPQGITAEIMGGNLQPTKSRRLTVRGSKATAVFDDLAAHRLVLDHQPTPLPLGSPLENLLTAFAQLILEGSHPLAGIEMAQRVAQVLSTLESRQQKTTPGHAKPLQN